MFFLSLVFSVVVFLRLSNSRCIYSVLCCFLKAADF